MLTGDKKETAINIGYSCSLLHDDMNVLQCNESSEADIERWADEQLAASVESSAPLALVIDGKTLTYITNERYPGFRAAFCSLGQRSGAWSGPGPGP